ncbi:MAG: GNAT family N-acetyltransferase [Acidobacteria bacterium]|nr:GNAT family N-acetyltransferase [Acidobacteriota bacterium]
MRQRLKQWLFGLAGKDAEAVVVTFLSGDAAPARAMAEEIRQLIPDREHFTVEPVQGSTWRLWRELRRRFRRKRIGMAAVLFGSGSRHRALRRAAFLLAPTRILAFNRRGERHHLKLSSWIASWLFLRGVPLDRIWLRPWWLCPWKKDRSVFPRDCRVLAGRPASSDRRRVGVVSPYFPYPLAHGGAVRIFHLLREMAREFDVYLFAFSERQRDEDLAPVLEFCTQAALLPVPRYREPRWSTIAPPEVREFGSQPMRELVARLRKEWKLDLVQVEYTYMAGYPGDVLVEHDVTFDLYDQVRRRHPSLGAWWNWRRWACFERKAVRRYARVVVMSDKDASLLPRAQTRVIPNGVDLDRFQPEPEPEGQRLLFVGSFRHFPNLTAYRFFIHQVWPALRDRFPEMTLTVVAGPDGLRYLGEAPPRDSRVRFLEFVRDVRPLYAEASVVLVPTLESAGTNLKVLEAMAMERAVISTSSGCAGLGLKHGESVWIAGTAEAFAAGVSQLVEQPALRAQLARAARRIAEQRFDWKGVGGEQRRLLRELLEEPVTLRPGQPRDLERMAQIQSVSPEAAQWKPDRYLPYDTEVAEVGGQVAAFLVSRQTAPGESEILNLAVDPDFRRRGLASALVRSVQRRRPGQLFLEVRESNLAAQDLYGKLGFDRVGRRPKYYENPPEAAVVMRLKSC